MHSSSKAMYSYLLEESSGVSYGKAVRPGMRWSHCIASFHTISAGAGGAKCSNGFTLSAFCMGLTKAVHCASSRRPQNQRTYLIRDLSGNARYRLLGDSGGVAYMWLTQQYGNFKMNRHTWRSRGPGLQILLCL